MRYIRGFILTLALFVALSPTAQGAGDSDQSGWDALPRAELELAAGEYAPDMALDEGIDLNRGLQDLLDTGTDQVFGVLRTALKSGVLLLAGVLFCSLGEGAA